MLRVAPGGCAGSWAPWWGTLRTLLPAGVRPPAAEPGPGHVPMGATAVDRGRGPPPRLALGPLRAGSPASLPAVRARGF